MKLLSGEVFRGFFCFFVSVSSFPLIKCHRWMKSSLFLKTIDPNHKSIWSKSLKQDSPVQTVSVESSVELQRVLQWLKLLLVCFSRAFLLKIHYPTPPQEHWGGRGEHHTVLPCWLFTSSTSHFCFLTCLTCAVTLLLDWKGYTLDQSCWDTLAIVWLVV